MARFNEEMNNKRLQDRNTPEPKLSKTQKEIADVERQIRVDSNVNKRISKLLIR